MNQLELELKLLAEEHKPEIITINETWMLHNEAVNISYQTITNNKVSQIRGGGVATLVRNDINYINKYQIHKHEFITINIHKIQTNKYVCSKFKPG